MNSSRFSGAGVWDQNGFRDGPASLWNGQRWCGLIVQSLGWAARAVNPVCAVSQELGVAWLVQAVTEPPKDIFSTKNGEVLINKITAKACVPSSTGPVVASANTVSLCTSSPSVDPWLQSDPWQSTVSKLPVSRPVAADAVMQLKDVEARLEKTLFDKLKSTNMETDETEQRLDQFQQGTDARLQALESQFATMTTRQSQLEQQFQDHSVQTRAQISQFQHQVSTQLDSQSMQISSMFSKQMADIERLLEKRQRTE